MIRFTKKQIEVLHKNGYEEITDNTYRKFDWSGDDETIVKVDKDEFEYHYTVSEEESDIYRANSGESKYSLTWEEIKNIYI